MKCPNDGTTLIMSERTGVEIDYCPECRGVWLDRGELDKILDRAATEVPSATVPPVAPAPLQPPTPHFGEPRYDDRRDYDGRDDRYGDNGGYRKKRKESWLSELFD